VWTRPGAGFLCIEPWQGYAAPLGFAGELKDKPGGLLLAANASTEFTIEICLLERTSHPLDPSLAIRPCLAPPRAKPSGQSALWDQGTGQ